MTIIYGTKYYGKVATLNEQWVETKFAHLFFIPLFPIESTLVMESSLISRTGMPIATNTKSVIATYLRVFTLIFTLSFAGITWLNFYAGAEGAGGAWLSALFLLTGTLITACIYLYFFYGRSTAEEITIRKKIGSCTGIFALPSWFNHQQSKDRLYHLEQRYRENYPGQHWKTDVLNHQIEAEKRPLLYAIALFNCMTYDIPENDELYFKADILYQPG